MARSIMLRGGWSTTDRRLDAIPEFDPRSRRYPVSEVLTDKQRGLRSFGWDCDVWLNQGTEGAAVGYAWAHELAADPAAVKGVTKKLARDIYKNARRVDEWAGERYSGTSVLAGAKIVRFRGYMSEYRWGFGVIDALLAIAYFGPVVLGIPWYESMNQPRPSGLLEVSKDHQGNRHAILATGVALRARLRGEAGPLSVVHLRNSWGKRWGVEGDCWILVDDFEALLRDGGECCVPIGRSPRPDRAFLALTRRRR
jgi:hypothetical protein